MDGYGMRCDAMNGFFFSVQKKGSVRDETRDAGRGMRLLDAHGNGNGNGRARKGRLDCKGGGYGMLWQEGRREGGFVLQPTPVFVWFSWHTYIPI